MKNKNQSPSREQWSGKLGFILAVAGSAVGLGNIWKFPYITGINGGGAFVLVYLGCILLCGFPILVCELVLGRAARQNPIRAFSMLENHRSLRMTRVLAPLLAIAGIAFIISGRYGLGVMLLLIAFFIFRYGFAAIGGFSVLAALLILSYYAVIGGWIMDYIFPAFAGKLAFHNLASADQAFSSLLASPLRVYCWTILFLALCAVMIVSGVKKGIERYAKILMPVLLLLLLLVIVRSVTLPGAAAGVEFYLRPDFSKLSGRNFLEALGHSFYTLSIGMAINITYGSYLSKKINIFTSVAWVIVADTLMALLAGLAIFPAVFAMGFQPDAGPGLIFRVLPATFSGIPGGGIWLGIFFVMLTIAALTSAAALMECGVSPLIDQFHMRRTTATTIIFTAVGALSLLSVISTGDWSQAEWLRRCVCACFGDSLRGSWFDLLDYITSNWMIPVVAFFTSVFVGWCWRIGRAGRELHRGRTESFRRSLAKWFNREELAELDQERPGITPIRLWGIIVKFVTPVVVVLIFLKAVGIL